MADAQYVQNVLQGLRALQNESLSIIKLGEPISGSATSHRTSDASTSAFEDPSPSSLEADLVHYKVRDLQRLQWRCVAKLIRSSSPNSASHTSNK